MNPRVIVVGSGMGGLAAALRLARLGCRVRLIEASDHVGGLAAGLEREGFRFDGGPYLLLDRPGLEWAFHELGLNLAEKVPMRRAHQIYQVESADGSVVRISADLDETVLAIEKQWLGGGNRYRQFVGRISLAHERLRPLLTSPRVGISNLIRGGKWRDIPFLLCSLGSILARADLPPAVVDAVAIWAHVAGQTTATAPGPLAFVTAIMHGVGAFVPTDGIGAVPLAVAAAARDAGVEFEFGTKVAKIVYAGRRVRGVTTADGRFLEADAVVSNRNGVGTCLELVREALPVAALRRLEQLPLQSPGVCAYLAVRGGTRPPYLRFRLPGDGELCRLLVTPAAVIDGLDRDGWVPARLIVPMAYAEAQRVGRDGQREYLERALAEPWWREHVAEARVLATRIPADWGAACHLYRESMNPVMTARSIRAGRLAHRSPYIDRLYLSGSATHPGQWVSFCAISGILAADRLLEDFT